MKKIILIVALIITLQNNLLAENFNKFNQWLLKNGYSQFLKEGGAELDICTLYKKKVMLGLTKNVRIIPKEK